MTVVMSTAAISASSPAMPLPSRCRSSVISASCRAEALGVDRVGIVATLDQQLGDALDEGGRPAHVAARALARRELGEHPRVDAPRPAGPPGRRLARVRALDAQPRARLERLEVVAVQDVT